MEGAMVGAGEVVGRELFRRGEVKGAPMKGDR